MWAFTGLMPCAGDEDDGASLAQGLSRECRIVLVSGFESFNVELYKKVCIRKRHPCPMLHAPSHTKTLPNPVIQQHCAISVCSSGVSHSVKVCWM